MKFGLAIFLLGVSLTAGAEVRWRDEKTGTRFLALDGKMTYPEAYRGCQARGWDLFNFEYLSPEEQTRFLASRELDSLAWEKSFVGEPGERSEITLWGTSEFGAVVTHGAQSSGKSGLFLQRFADEKTTRAKVKWAGEDDTRSVLCMYQSHTWEGCSHELHCTFEGQGGGTYKLRYHLYEYGPHRRDALNRIKERIKNFDGGVGGRCELAPREPYCISYR